MRQSLSLLNLPALSGLMPAIRASMRRIAGEDADGRKLLVDKLNAVSAREGVQVTGGNAKQVSMDTVNKWLSPSDTNHAPSLNAILVFCLSMDDYEPLALIVKAIMPGGMLLTPDEVKFYNLGKAEMELRAARKRKRQIEDQL